MKIKILGTAAAEAWPGIFCNCPTCEQVRKIKGKNIRTRSSIIVDDTCQFDGGFDNFMHSLYEGVDFTKVRDIFISHEHEDHFFPADISIVLYDENISLHCNQGTINRLLALEDIPTEYTGVNLVVKGDVIKTKDGHKITAIKAEHNGDQTDQLNYIIEYKGKTCAYLTDTGLYTDEETWDFLGKFKFDCIISECTSGWADALPIYHQTFKGVLKLKERLLKMGSITEETPFYITHFSHNCNCPTHEEMERRANPHNINVCYDGLEIEI